MDRREALRRHDDNTWTWDTTGLATGTYYALVYARSAGSTAPWEAVSTAVALRSSSFVRAATRVTLTPSLASPRTPGASVVWTAAASGGSGNYSTCSTCTTGPHGPSRSLTAPRTTTPGPGHHWAGHRNLLCVGICPKCRLHGTVGGCLTAVAYVLQASSRARHRGDPYAVPCQPAERRDVGDLDGGRQRRIGNYQYLFYLHNGTSWTVAKPYGATNDNTWTWDTTGLATGTYYALVYARSAGSTAPWEAVSPQLPYVLQASSGPATAVTLTPSLASPRNVGTTLMWTAAASGGSGNYQYAFWLDNGSLSLAQAYSASNTWTWNTTGFAPGTYNVQVWARNAGSSADWEAKRTESFVLNAIPPATAVTLTPSPVSPQLLGTPVTWTAAASGGSGTYEYQFDLWNGTSFATVRPYSGTPTWTWHTDGLVSGITPCE